MKILTSLLLRSSLFAGALSAGAAQWSFDLHAKARPDADSGLQSAQNPTDEKVGLVSRISAPLARIDGAQISPGDELLLALDDGTLLRLVVFEAASAPLSGSGRVFLARGVEGSAVRSAVILVDSDGALHVSAEGLPGGRVVRIFPCDGSSTVEQLDPAALPWDEAEPLPTPFDTPLSDEADTLDEVALPSAADQSDQLVDILVGFDKGGSAFAKSNGGVTNFAEMAVQRMNLALADSDLDSLFRFRLVGVCEIDDTLSDITVDALTATTSGKGAWAALHEARDAAGADVVTTLIDTGRATGTCGLAWELTYTNASDAKRHANSAYNIVAIRSVLGNHTMTHEVGHNLGCGHSNAAGASSPGPAGFEYSSGYHFKGSDGVLYHTIMAYNSLNGETYQEAGVFSSPLLSVGGVPAGTADANDNRRVLTQTWAWAQNWREQVLPLDYDVFFSPGDGTLINGSLSVTLTPGKAGLPIRYTLDGSAPTLSSSLYSGAIVLSKTTTIRAATVFNGRLGPIRSARYALSDYGEALGAPQLTWTCASTSSPWQVQTTNTWDGVAAVQSGNAASAFTSPSPHLQTTVIGPTTMSFRYSTTLRNEDPYSWGGENQERFAVSVDGKEVWTASPKGMKTAWTLGEISIPEGSHKVQFQYLKVGFSSTTMPGVVYGVWLDDVRFDALSSPPSILPASTSEEATAATFQGSQTITIAPPSSGAVVFYTLDGSDPAGEDSLRYLAPFEITASTLVRAIAVEPGRDQSAPVSALYLERHRPVLPGEWSADPDGLFADAAADSGARLVLGLRATGSNSGATESFRAIAENPAFLGWCAANGIYLLDADSVSTCGVETAQKRFDELCTQVSSSFNPTGPSLVVALPSGTSKTYTSLARSGQKIGETTYSGTVDSLIECLCAILGASAPSTPVATPASSLVTAFPATVSLSNPNGAGTIRYTLDGTVPTVSNGIAIASGASLSIPSAGAVLKAAVFSGNGGLSSPVLVVDYQTPGTFFGVDAFNWAMTGDRPWVVHEHSASPTLMNGHVEGSYEKFTSGLSATAREKGTLSFTVIDCGGSSVGTTTIKKPDGTSESFSSRGWYLATTNTYKIAMEPGQTVSWTRNVTSRNYYGDSSGPSGAVYNGTFLLDFTWVPERKETETPVPVPYSWIDGRYPGRAATAADYDAIALSDEDGDGYQLWEEYLCGTNPDDADDFLRATIEIGSDGEPVVGWNLKQPLEGSEMIVEGKESLLDEAWSTENTSSTRFFRVRVVAPQ